MIGLSDFPTENNGIGSLDYALYLHGDGGLQVYEGGTGPFFTSTYLPEDILSIVHDDATIRYYRGGELLRSVNTTAGRTFWFDSTFYNVGGSVTNLTFTAANTSATNILLRGYGANEQAVLKEGWMATALLYGGGAQLICITQDINANGSGDATLVFEPQLRGIPFAIVTGRPFAQVAPAGSRNGWGVDPGQLYGFALEVEEAF